MTRYGIDRRTFLTAPLALLLAPVRRLAAEPAERRSRLVADVRILFGTLTFELDGALDERVDRARGRYEVVGEAQGNRIRHRLESRGVMRSGRWSPAHSSSLVDVNGRVSRTEIHYDYDAGRVAYRFRGETFFLRRLRVVDDVVPLPETAHVDDAISAILNYADGLWPAQADGSFETQVVRRQRNEQEAPDEVATAYRAEIVPFVLRLDAATPGRVAGLFDVTRFSGWARRDKPGRVVFGQDRRPETIMLGLILGTSVTVTLKAA
jgi:hypothetical protein